MKPVWKWIIGIVIALVVIAAVVCGFVFSHNHMVGFRGDFREFGTYGYNPHMPMGRSFGYVSPMFGFGLIFLRGLIPLALLVLLAYGIYRLGFHNAQKTATNSVVEAAKAESEVIAQEPLVEMHTCPKCGNDIEEGWRNCPHCGKRL
jgi:hypothetical protein